MNIYYINNKSRIGADTESEAISYYKRMYVDSISTILVLTKKEQLIDEMVSCYDNLQDIIDVPPKGFFIMCEIVELSVKTTIKNAKV